MSMLWFRVPAKIYFKTAIIEEALTDLKNEVGRVMIVTDRDLTWLGVANRIKTICQRTGFTCATFDQIVKNPTMEDLQVGLTEVEIFKPDAIIALGGGSAMNYAKLLRIFYENPGLKIEDIMGSFETIRDRLHKNLLKGTKIHSLVCIPTTSGTGDEVTPYARFTLSSGEIELISDYHMTPDMAIVDPELTMAMPKIVAAKSGLYGLSMAIESYVSKHATDYTEPYAERSIISFIANFQESIDEENMGKLLDAKSHMHNAATLAGMASGNTFLGICNSLSHFITNKFKNIHPGLASAILLPKVIKFNAKDENVKKAYAKLAVNISVAINEEIHDKSDDEKIEYLIAHINKLSTINGLPTSFKDCEIPYDEFKNSIDEIANKALKDQGTACNPVTPTLNDLKNLLQ